LCNITEHSFVYIILQTERDYHKYNFLNQFRNEATVLENQHFENSANEHYRMILFTVDGLTVKCTAEFKLFSHLQAFHHAMAKGLDLLCPPDQQSQADPQHLFILFFQGSIVTANLMGIKHSKSVRFKSNILPLSSRNSGRCEALFTSPHRAQTKVIFREKPRETPALTDIPFPKQYGHSTPVTSLLSWPISIRVHTRSAALGVAKSSQNFSSFDLDADGAGPDDDSDVDGTGSVLEVEVEGSDADVDGTGSVLEVEAERSDADGTGSALEMEAEGSSRRAADVGRSADAPTSHRALFSSSQLLQLPVAASF